MCRWRGLDVRQVPAVTKLLTAGVPVDDCDELGATALEKARGSRDDMGSK